MCGVSVADVLAGEDAELFFELGGEVGGGAEAEHVGDGGDLVLAFFYIPPRIKVEIGCLSMDEPTEFRPINTLISKFFPEEDNELSCAIRTVVPTRTFLEKVFLLNEEFQKAKPRYRRMSRHLYDLERLMDTPYSREALADRNLYNAILEHRKSYYDLKYVDYSLHAPDKIDFLPPASEIDNWKADYAEMQRHFIFGSALSFDNLMKRMEELRDRFRNSS